MVEQEQPDVQQQQARWRPTRRQLWTTGVLLALAFVIIVICGYLFEWPWTGLGPSKVNGENQPAKTLWDWLDLLIVPAVLAVGGYLFTRSENGRREQSAKEQRDLDRDIADQRTQDDLLQAYLDDITELLVDEERPLHRASQGDSLSTVARARTLTILPCLDHTRKKRVLQFLYEAELIRKHRRGGVVSLKEATNGVVSLKEADLSEADLHQGHLRRASLRWANLREADLSEADLSEADLSEADLRDADLSEADLRDADLSGANLRDAKGVTQEQLEEEAITLAGATMPDGQILQGNAVPDGPTLEEWLKSRGRGEEGENE